MQTRKFPACDWYVKLAAILVLAGSAMCPGLVISQTHTFTGNGDGTTWGNALNWNNNNIPDTSSENAVIGLVGASPATVNLLSPVTVRSTLVQSGATLNLNAAANMTTFGMDVNNSNLAMNASLTVGTSTSSGLELSNSLFTLNSGTLTGSLSLTNSSSINRTGGQLALYGLVVNGPSAVSTIAGDSISNSILLTNGATFTSGQSFNLASTLTITGATATLNAVSTAQTVTVGSGGFLNVAGGLSTTTFGVTATSSTINQNSGTLNGGNFFATTISSGVLNLNGGNVAGTLKLNNSAGAASLVVRNGGLLNLYGLDITGATSLTTGAGDGISNYVSLASGANLTVGHSLNLASSISVSASTATLNGTTATYSISVFNGGVLSLNGATSTTTFGAEITSSTLNLNANLATSTFFGTTISSSIVNLNAGTISGSLYIDNLEGGVASQINRNGGLLNLHTLTIQGATPLTVTASDNVTNSINISAGAELTTQRILNLSSTTTVNNATLNLNHNLTTSQMNLSGTSALINRIGAGKFTTPTLRVSNGNSYTYGGVDTITGSMTVETGAHVAINQALSLTSTVTVNSATLKLNQNINASTMNLTGSSAIVDDSGGGHFSVSTLNLASGAVYVFDGLDTVSNTLSVTTGSTVTIDSAASLTSTATVNQSTMNLNQLLTTNTMNVTGNSAVINRTAGGRISAATLNVTAGAVHQIGALDTLTANLSVTDGSTVTVNPALSLTSSTSVNQSTLNLNQLLTTNSMTITGGSAVINRTGSGRFSTSALSVHGGASYIHDGVDSISSSVSIGSTSPPSSFTANANLVLTGAFTANSASIATLNNPTSANSFAISGNSILNVNANTNTNSTFNVSSSTMNVNANVAGGDTTGIILSAGILNLNSGTVSGRLTMNTLSSVASQLNRTGGTMSLSHLTISGTTTLALAAIDSVSQQITLSAGASVNTPGPFTTGTLSGATNSLFSVSQNPFGLDGLALNTLSLTGGAKLHINFDTLAAVGLDWGLRVNGNVQSALQNLLLSGSITTAGGIGQPITVIYDSANYGNFTYVGYISSVPEPGIAGIAGLFGLLLMARRRCCPGR